MSDSLRAARWPTPTPTRSVLGPMRQLWRRPDGRLRTPRQGWALAQGLWWAWRAARGDGEDGAREALSRLAAAGGHPIEEPLRLRLAARLRATGREDEVPALVAPATDHPDDPVAGWVWVAMRYLEAERDADALRALGRARELAAGGPLAEALPVVVGAVLRRDAPVGHELPPDLRTGDPALAALLAGERAAAHEEAGLLELAAAVLQRAVEGAGPTTEARLRWGLASVLLRLGRGAEAVPHLAWAGADPTLRFAADLARVRALLDAGAPATAAAVARGLLAWLDEPDPAPDPSPSYVERPSRPRQPRPEDLVELWHLLGRALAASGDRDGARNALLTGLGLCHTDLLRRGALAVDRAVEDAIATELRAIIG